MNIAVKRTYCEGDIISGGKYKDAVCVKVDSSSKWMTYLFRLKDGTLKWVSANDPAITEYLL